MKEIKIDIEKDEFKVVFKHHTEGKTKDVIVTAKTFLEVDEETLHEWLDNSEPCTCSGCHNEEFTGCDCTPEEDYENYLLSEIFLIKNY
ncbi:hypothetical protein PG593_05190 [Riemerella anatipestifer]|nr:hypothetical protein [Riemerella anatipestifer]